MGTVRFLLALSVVATHSPGGAIFGITMMSGITAVQCFYVISGFLITMILNERKEYQSAGNFYVSRYLRLWPTYILIAALTLILFKRNVMFSQLPALLDWPGMMFVAFSNLTLFFQDWFLFIRFDGGHIVPTSAFGTWPGPQANSFLLVPQCWTIGVELTFYVIAPFVCRRWWSALGLFAFGTGARVVVAHYNPTFSDPWIYRFAPSEMMMFGAGAVSYFVGKWVCPRLPKATKVMCIGFMLAFAGIAFFGFNYGISARLLLMNYPTLFLMAIAAPSLFYGTKNLGFDRVLGELSYPMYVSHICVYSLINAYLPASIQAGNALYALCVITVSLALVFLVIGPIDRVRRNLAASMRPFREFSPVPA